MTQNNTNKKQQLRKLLKSQAEELSDEVIQAEGPLAEEKLRKLEEMEKLIQVLEHTDPPPPSRWPVITLLLATLVIVSILLFARVSTTEINLNVSLSEITFRLSQQQVITNVVRLSSLGVAGLQQIEFPDTGSSDNYGNFAISSANAIRLAIDTVYSSERSLTLAPLLLNSKATISISDIGENGEAFGLLIRDSLFIIKADVMGLVATAIPGTPSSINNFTFPKSVVLRSGADEVAITIKTLFDSKNYFNEQIFIDRLSFIHIDEYMDDQRTVFRKVSGIKKGSIYFESLGGTELSLHPAEEITFKQLYGYINNLKLANGDISFTFRGTVSGMTTGGQKDRISLMPTYLEWLMARHSLSLLWGTTIYILGLLLGIMHWWKTTK